MKKRKKKAVKKENLHLLKGFFAVLSLINLMIISYLLFPSSVRRAVFPLIAVLAFASMILGIVLNSLTIKYNLKGKLALFFIMVGTSSIGVLLFSILHNIFYAFAVVFSDITFMKIIFDFLHIMSFIIAVIICPVAFVVGAVGSLFLFKKK
jgi:hypothetical protein